MAACGQPFSIARRMLATGQIRQETYQKYQRLYDAVFSGREAALPVFCAVLPRNGRGSADRGIVSAAVVDSKP